jgi:hypothetical protein
MRAGYVLLRVKAGGRPLPYNDGEGSKLHQPLEVFEAPVSYLDDFRGVLEAVNEAGEPLEALPVDASTESAIRAARPHERVTMLQNARTALEEQHQRSLQVVDDQIAQAEQDAQREADARRARQAPVADAPAPDPAPTPDAVPAAGKSRKTQGETPVKGGG